jgi:uncharacterized delta-60 repeat protein
MSGKLIGVACAAAGAGLVLCSAGSAGSEGAAYSVLLQPNGKIVVAGWGQRGSQDTIGLARYTPAGVLDKSFGLRGKVAAPFGARSIGYSAALQPDGKIVAGGYSGGNGRASTWQFGLARYTAKGALDTTFGKKGRVRTSFGPSGSLVSAVAMQPNGKIVAAGNALPPPSWKMALARYTRTGKLDPSFGAKGVVRAPSASSDAVASAMTLQEDGKILVAGETGFDFVLLRYLPNGSLDQTFGSGGIVTTALSGPAQANAVALQGDGKIVLAGYVQTDPVGPGYEFALARYDADGSLDPTFGSGGVVTTSIGNILEADLPYGGIAYAVAIQPDGKVDVGGSDLIPWPDRGKFALVRYNADGSLDSSFGDGGKVATSFGYGPPENPTEDGDSVRSLALQPDGKIVAAGESQFGPHTEQYAVALARYLSDGSLDPAFGQAGEVKTSLALCSVPKLRGRRMDWFAQQRIKGAHCAVGKITRVHSHLKRRRIISERPRPGTVHVEGTKVRVLVSLGRR